MQKCATAGCADSSRTATEYENERVEFNYAHLTRGLFQSSQPVT